MLHVLHSASLSNRKADSTCQTLMSSPDQWNSMARHSTLNRRISLDSASFGPGIVSPSAVPATPYTFPTHKLKAQLQGKANCVFKFLIVCCLLFLDPKKIPLVIVACGSYSPITYLHLRMFEMGYDYIADSDTFEIIGGYFSPVSDAYAKPGLAPWFRRVDMCSLAVQDSSWIMVDSWEPSQSTYIRTARVLDHFNECLNGPDGGIGGVLMPDGILARPVFLLNVNLHYSLRIFFFRTIIISRISQTHSNSITSRR